jgi:hypothetical protein
LEERGSFAINKGNRAQSHRRKVTRLFKEGVVTIEGIKKTYLVCQRRYDILGYLGHEKHNTEEVSLAMALAVHYFDWQLPED